MQELNDEKLKRLFSKQGSLRENSWLEFKESFNWGSKDEYGRTAAAFANRAGGFLVYGIKNSPIEIVGIRNNNFEIKDESNITGYFHSVFSPEIHFDKYIVKHKNKTLGLLKIYQSDSKPVIAIKNDGAIKESEIYYRYNARTEKIKYPELVALFQLLVENERQRWIDILSNISKIGPENSGILNILTGEIKGDKGSLIIDEKLVPKLRFIKEGDFKRKGKPVLKLVGEVRQAKFSGSKFRLTNDANAMEVRVSDDLLLKEYSIDYDSLSKKLLKRYSDFKLNPKYHRIKNELKKDPKYHIVRYLDPKNPRSSKKDYYHPRILKAFDKYYTKR
ncbi:MAG: hypothetical protein A3J07_02400 [Candidatus Doudnabacteria bacterium RIFCSPLOWO2_02_FULL_49_13]|uniref:Schlafen AlbA-2 domain-containing protein n=1 Tax=Candidatus Doudnabacteria bacterium RIFCSPHIGHO2_12_FULL_48_16 TaxID=1817838 RepID=A0A1F5PLK0_9BACT|nr:MAG: hypothetical protein A3E29_01915 [Candidatus Doudnabacteria bacterium RIFCSPHIGHO2_12_FULL_48_16]OGE97198.1 MAG: hypothetical protein A2990_01200 [Candidatus Doudnabacteria bacterium RIFCSPLOWO2_01_FULL_49_40]OGF02924.1 MAG: hypothetical protein A3J07_02400 [Candidatus Doudnabacteria bacterium RIFCSPLOWO2_02_FULL_49_13]